MASDISRRRKAAAQEQGPLYMERRGRLMGAAADIFREQGLDGASLNDIAKRAGLDRATLYYYIESKEDLYRAVVEDVVHDNVNAVEKVRNGEGSGADKLSQAIHLLMDSYEKNYPHLFLFVAEDFGRRGQVRRQGRKPAAAAAVEDWRTQLVGLGDAYYSALKSVVAEGLADGSLSSQLSPGLVAHGVIGMVSWSHRWFKPEGRASAEEIADGFTAMVLDGIGVRRG